VAKHGSALMDRARRAEANLPDLLFFLDRGYQDGLDDGGLVECAIVTHRFAHLASDANKALFSELAVPTT